MPSSRRRAGALLALAALLLAPQPATAHFALRSPASWRVQDVVGNPQKMGPCGDEDTATTTGAVTAFAPGETITITLDETIFHPGHYRVALAVNDRSELPPEPPVSPGTTACGSVPIANPVFPVLVDGALQHTEPFSGSRFIQVTLPSDVTCTHCTLQVLEFMSEHPTPCFYHHCADISIGVAGGGCGSDAECADDSVCTSDRCNPTTKACEHVDVVTPTCDDGNACTRDACSATEGCISQPITLGDVGAGFLGAVDVAPCSTERIPPAIGTLFGKADGFVTRAARSPVQAKSLLRRAAKRLRTAARKIAKGRERSLSTECAAALDAVVRGAETRVDCLLNGVRPARRR